MEKFLLALVVVVLFVFCLRKVIQISILGFRYKRDPNPGEQWYFVDDNGPWPCKNGGIVTIVDVKSGWVRYDMQFLKDQRCKLDIFARMYRPLE